jgi:Amt family ammonium transporter
MNKIFSKLGVIGLLSLFLLSFSQIGVSNEVFDITKETVLVAEQDVLVVEEAVEEAPTLNSGDTAWMIVATILVIVMAIPGLALFYGGLVRSKNMLSVLMQVFVTFSLMSILWVIYGYSVAFSDGTGTPLGTDDRRWFWRSIFKWYYPRYSVRHNS